MYFVGTGYWLLLYSTTVLKDWKQNSNQYLYVKDHFSPLKLRILHLYQYTTFKSLDVMWPEVTYDRFYCWGKIPAITDNNVCEDAKGW